MKTARWKIVLAAATISIAAPAISAAPCAPMDFDGDCKSDILWRNAATGENILFGMNGASIATQSSIDVLADQAWQVKGVGDFDGDGRADILWRHATSGENRVYLMNGSAISAQASIDTVADLDWQVKGIGDFDGDGRADILWRNVRTGENRIDLMNGTAIVSQANVNTLDPAWQVKGVGDFDGDGRADILWRHAVSGENQIFLMNGAGTVSQGPIDVVADNAWEVKGIGDFDGDGRADILWRHAASGENVLYLMNGLSIAFQSAIDTVADQGWQVKAVGDFDGDGRADILWRHAASGENRVYLMNGPVIAMQGSLDAVPDLNWMPRAAPALADTSYPRAPIVVPGTFAAEDFDYGGEGVAYHDNIKANGGNVYRPNEDVDLTASTDPTGGGYVVTHFQTGEWLAYTVNVTTTRAYDIKLRVASGFSTSAFRIEIDGVDVTGRISVPNTGGWASFRWVGRNGVPLAAGQHVLKIVSEQQYFDLNSVRITAAPAAVPGTIEAEDFDAGGEGVGYHDNVKGNAGGYYRTSEDVDIVKSGSSYVVNNFESGEWLAYTINVATAGLYDLELRAASDFPTSAYRAEIDGVDVTGRVSVPNTGGWSSFQWVGRKTVNLAAGQHVLKIVSDQQYFDLDSIRLSASTAQVRAVPGTLEAEDFDQGGEGVGYHDNVKGNAGGQYRTGEDVDIIKSGTSTVVNNFETGEWLAYTISVAAAGWYDIELRAASGFSTSAYHAEIDGVDVTGRVGVPNTGGWSSFQWVGKKTVNLAAGEHVLRIVADQQYFDLDSIRVSASAAPDNIPPSTPSGLVVSALGAGSVTLSWNPATDNVGVTGYRVYRDGALVASPTAPTAQIGALLASTAYSFTVAAVDAAGNASAPSAPLAVTTAAPADTTPPSTPTGLAASAVGTTSFTLSWSPATDNVGVAGYRVYRGATLIASPAGTSVGVSGLSASTTYAFTVAAFDAAGNTSPQSAPLSLTTMAAAPPPPPPPPPPSQVLWTAGAESGSLGEFEGENNSGSADSLAVLAANEGIAARKGSWVIKQSVFSSGGSRLYRNSAINNVYRTGNPIYYSFWAYFPQATHLSSGGFFNLLQIQSINPGGNLDPVWILGLHPSSFTLRMEWWSNLQMSGPHAGESGGRAYDQAVPIPLGQWVFMQVMVT
ncbi:MAG TPA: carbohydrate-binding protein, partial [Vicinamibacterales bacterium]|nr:carbohydrate-binding protein [Vicinamibacterales bacterium]